MISLDALIDQMCANDPAFAAALEVARKASAAGKGFKVTTDSAGSIGIEEIDMTGMGDG